MSEFKFFQKLPKELRDQIWDLAIRDDSPAAHFFTIYHGAFDPNFTVQPETSFHTESGGHELTRRFGLAAPDNSKSTGYSWVDRNASAYMEDSGLWTACWGSRMRMLWHFRPRATPSPAYEVLLPPRLPVTLPFRRDNGERQYLTIEPSQDLLCVQFARGSVISPEDAHRWSLVQNLPHFIRQQRRPSGEPAAVAHVRHVGVEFDPVWLEVWMADYFLSGFSSSPDNSGLEGFWFIARRLQRRYRTDEDRRGRCTFRAAEGMEFVEVLRGDDEWWDPSWGSGTVDHRGPYRSHVDDLAQHLNRVRERDIIAQMGEEEEDESVYDSDLEERLMAPGFGVLACVKAGSEKHLPTKSEWLSGRWH